MVGWVGAYRRSLGFQLSIDIKKCWGGQADRTIRPEDTVVCTLGVAITQKVIRGTGSSSTLRSIAQQSKENQRKAEKSKRQKAKSKKQKAKSKEQKAKSKEQRAKSKKAKKMQNKTTKFFFLSFFLSLCIDVDFFWLLLGTTTKKKKP